jgi:hypothetical protein
MKLGCKQCDIYLICVDDDCFAKYHSHWTTVDDLVIPFFIVLYLLVPDQFQIFNKPKPHCHHTQIYGG